MTTFVGSAQGTGSSPPTMPTLQAGDLILICTTRNASNTAPTLLTGYTNIGTITGTTNAMRVQWKKAASGSETVPSNAGATATELVVHVYRASSGNAGIIGSSLGQTGTASPISYGGLTLKDTSGASWIAAFGQCKGAGTNVETPPTGFVLREDDVATGELASFDTNGGVSSFTTKTVTLTGTITTWKSFTIEIMDVPADGLDPIRTNANVTLSNGNKTGTASGSSTDRASYSIASVSTGKYIFKGTYNAIGASNEDCLGVANANATTGFMAAGTDGVAIDTAGNVWYNGSTLATVSTASAGNVGWLAIDFTPGARKLWYRVNSGLWNNSGTANPDTGVGGISFSVTGDLFAGISVFDSSDQITIDLSATGNPTSSFLPFYTAPAGLAPFVDMLAFQPPNPATSLSLNNQRGGMLAAAAIGIEAPFVPPVQAPLPFGWPVQSVQPPNPATISLNNRSFAALVGGDAGNQFPQIRFLPFAPVQNVQPPNPITSNISLNNRRSAGLIGGHNPGNQAPQIAFQPFGWPIQSVQPPNPATTNISLNNRRAGALVGSIEPRIESPAIRWFNAGWEVPPPTAARRMRVSVTYGDDGAKLPVAPVAAVTTWGFDPALALTRFARTVRGVLTVGDSGHENIFSPPVAITTSWGFDQALPVSRRAARLDPTFIENIEAPEIVFYPFGWPVQPVQPRHPTPERRFAAPFSNIEAVFVAPVPSTTGWGFDPSGWQPASRRARVVLPPLNIEGTFAFTPPVAPTVWEANWPQPPHPRPERAAAIMPQSPIEGRFANFQPFGWHVPAPEPHRRSERAGAVVLAIALVESPLTRFIPFWMMPPPHPEPHPRRERSGAVAPPIAVTESRLQTFYPTFWHVLPPEPHPRPERGGALLPAGVLPIIKFRAIALNPNYIAAGRPRVMVSLGQPRVMVAVGLPRDMVSLGQPRQRTSIGAKRNRVVLGITNQVSQTNELLPPIDASVEEEAVTFDFGLILVSGVTITSIASLTCEVVSGDDPTPSSRLIGPAAIVTSPNSSGPNQAVVQLVGDMVGGVTYRLQCVAKSSDGQTISLWNHLACQTPN